MLFFAKPSDRFYPLPGTRQRFWVSPCGRGMFDAFEHDVKNITLDPSSWPEDYIRCETIEGRPTYQLPRVVVEYCAYPEWLPEDGVRELSSYPRIEAWVVSIAALKGFHLDPFYLSCVEPIYLDNDIGNPSPTNLAYRFSEPVESALYPGTRMIPGYTRYSISEDGLKIYSHESNRIVNAGLKSAPFDGHGYRHVNPSNDMGTSKTLGVHRLVALAWVPDYKPHHLINGHVDHINTNRSDNFYKNLQWLTISQNILKSRHEHALRLKGKLPLYDYRETIMTGKPKEIWHNEETAHLFDPGAGKHLKNMTSEFSMGKMELLNIKTKEVLEFDTVKNLSEFIGRTHGVVHNAVKNHRAGHWTVLANEYLFRDDDRKWPEIGPDSFKHKNANGRFTILVKEPGKEDIEEWFSASKLFKKKGISRKQGFKALKNKDQGPIGGILIKIKGDETPWVA